MNTHFIKTIVLIITLGMYYPIASAQQGDTLFIQRGKSGKVDFARFKKDTNPTGK